MFSTSQTGFFEGSGSAISYAGRLTTGVSVIRVGGVLFGVELVESDSRIPIESELSSLERLSWYTTMAAVLDLGRDREGSYSNIMGYRTNVIKMGCSNYLK